MSFIKVHIVVRGEIYIFQRVRNSSIFTKASTLTVIMKSKCTTFIWIWYNLLSYSMTFPLPQNHFSFLGHMEWLSDGDISVCLISALLLSIYQSSSILLAMDKIMHHPTFHDHFKWMYVTEDKISPFFPHTVSLCANDFGFVWTILQSNSIVTSHILFDDTFIWASCFLYFYV